MRIIDSIADWLIYTPAMEQAHSRKKAKGVVMAVNWQISQTLVKVLTMPESHEVPHWKTELNYWLESLNYIKLRPVKKRLSADVFFGLLYVSHFEDVDDLDNHLDALAKYDITLTIAQKVALLNRIHDIMVPLCNDLSQGKFTSIDDYLNG